MDTGGDHLRIPNRQLHHASADVERLFYICAYIYICIPIDRATDTSLCVCVCIAKRRRRIQVSGWYWSVRTRPLAEKKKRQAGYAGYAIKPKHYTCPLPLLEPTMYRLKGPESADELTNVHL